MKSILAAMLTVSLGVTQLRAASARNEFVEVSSSTPGVDAVVAVKEPAGEFHVTTRDVEEGFHADVHIQGLNGVVAKPADARMALGQTVEWSAVEALVEEAPVSGTIVLFRVDVEIDGIGEDEETAVGAQVVYADCAGGIGSKNCRKELKHVKVSCTPSNRPETERIVLAYPAGHLFEKQGNEYVPAAESYTAKEIHSKNFYLHGHAVSTQPRDCAVTATHSVNGCSDVANYTVVAP